METKLEELCCGFNMLERIDISLLPVLCLGGCQALENLDCSANNINIKNDRGKVYERNKKVIASLVVAAMLLVVSNSAIKAASIPSIKENK